MPENKAALELSRIPLLCSLICMVFFLRGGKLPKSRRGLYEISTKLLVETRDEHRGISVARKYSAFVGSRRIEVLRRIALLMPPSLPRSYRPRNRPRLDFGFVPRCSRGTPDYKSTPSGKTMKPLG